MVKPKSSRTSLPRTSLPRTLPLSRIRIVRRGPGAQAGQRVAAADIIALLPHIGDRRGLGPEEIARELRGLAELLVAAGTAQAPLEMEVVAMFAEGVLTRAAARLEAMATKPAKAAEQYRVEIRGANRRRRRR